jgi:hypothetical protein
MIVNIAEAAPLTTDEKEVFLPDLKQRNLNPLMLDIINNIPERTASSRYIPMTASSSGFQA